MIYYIRHEWFSKRFSSLLNALETVNQAEINMNSKMGGLPFQSREVQQGIPRNLSTNPYMSTYVEMVSCGEFFLAKILQKSSQGPTKVHFFHKNI